MEGRGEGEKSVWYFRGRFGWSRGRARGRELWHGRGVSEEPAEDHAIRGRGISRGDRRERASSAEDHAIRGRGISRGNRRERGSSVEDVRGRSVEADRRGRGLSVDAGSMRRRFSVDLSGSIFTDPNLPPRALGHANVHVELSKKQQQERRIKELRKELAERKPNLDAIGHLLNDRKLKSEAQEVTQVEKDEEKNQEEGSQAQEVTQVAKGEEKNQEEGSQAQEVTQVPKDEEKNQEEGSRAEKDEEYC